MPAVGTVIELPDLSGLTRATASELEGLLARYGEARRLVDAGVARIAGEVARRSSPSAGHAGLAQRSGDRTADGFVSRVAGTSTPEARRLVAAGRLLDSPDPWFADVAAAAAAGEVSIGVAVAITSGLGAPSASVAPDALLDAAQQLLASRGLTPEQAGRAAREARDALEPDGVVAREARVYQQRDARIFAKAAGGYRLEADLTTDAGAFIADAIECVVSPRVGGPRFISDEERARQDAIARDPRTLGQMTHDVLVELIRAGAGADPTRMLGVRKPGVRVIVRAEGATLEETGVPVSVGMAELLACVDGAVPILVSEKGIDVGRSRRVFTEDQRIALAAIWGGCAVESCARPPVMTEAHHIREWADGGATDLCNGILLCRHHHLLLHNGGWAIDRNAQEWWMRPPGGSGGVEGAGAGGRDAGAGGRGGGVDRPVRLVARGVLAGEWDPGGSG